MIKLLKQLVFRQYEKITMSCGAIYEVKDPRNFRLNLEESLKSAKFRSTLSNVAKIAKQNKVTE